MSKLASRLQAHILNSVGPRLAQRSEWLLYLLVSFMAEARGLLPADPSLARLCDHIASQAGPDPHIVPHRIATVYHENRHILYPQIPPIPGWPDFHAQPLPGDRVLALVLDGLARLPNPDSGRLEPVDYAGLDVRFLGTIYESLLAADPQRRAGGVYYTPDFIVDAMARYVLNPILNARFAGLRAQAHAHTPESALAAALDLTILDPAVGCGAFLIAAARFVTDRVLAFLRTAFPDYDFDPLTLRREVLARCIFGLDRDPFAVKLAQLSLWLDAADSGLAPDGLHIRAGNALLTDARDLLPPGRAGFDAVIGNPPYVAWHAIDAVTRSHLEHGVFLGCEYAARPHHADAQPNLYLFFLQVMIAALRSGGRGCFILPQEWLDDERAGDFRRCFSQQAARGVLVFFDPVLRLFDSPAAPVGTTSLLLGVIKAGDRDLPGVFESLDLSTQTIPDTAAALDALDFWNLSASRTGTVRQADPADLLHHSWRFCLRSDGLAIRAIFDRRADDMIITGDREWFQIGGGFQPPVALVPAFTLDRTAFEHVPVAEQRFVYPAVLHARSLQRYYLQDEERWWIVLNMLPDLDRARYAAPILLEWIERYRTHLLDRLGTDWWRFPNVRNLDVVGQRVEKLLTPRTSDHNAFCLDQTGTLFKGTNAYIRVLPPYDNAYVLALLNSRLLDGYYARFGKRYHNQARKYEPGKIAHFPIRRIEFTTPTDERARFAREGQTLVQRGEYDVVARFARQHTQARRTDVVHDLLAYLAREMTRLHAFPQAAAEALTRIDRLIDSIVAVLYAFDTDEIATIERRDRV